MFRISLHGWMLQLKRKIRHLDFCWSGNLRVHTNHLRLYKCETLVYLKLKRVIFEDAKFVSFPCLETMLLEDVSFPNKAAFEKLVSRCPVLEELEIFINEDDDKGFQVQSQFLKRLTLVRISIFNVESVPGLLIDAPLLCCLRITVHCTESFIVKNLESNAKLDISLGFGLGDINESTRNNIRCFLSGISRVGDMNIYSETFKVWGAGSQVMIFSSVPKCLMSSLEFIKILIPVIGHAADLNMIVRYFLENSAILKKFTLRMAKDSWREKYIRASLPKIPRGSTKCEVDVSVWLRPKVESFMTFRVNMCSNFMVGLASKLLRW